MTASNSQSPRSKITTVADALTTSERRIAMALLSNYPEAGLQSVAAFAGLAKVSSPTIIRFIRKIGYAQYSEFQNALRQELVEFKYSPAQMLASSTSSADFSNPTSLTSLEPLNDEITEAAKLVTSAGGRVFIIGGIWSHPTAIHLTNSLQRIRSNCFILTLEDLPPAIVGADRNTVFIVLDFRRYTEELFSGMQFVHDKGAQIILITDRWVSPIAAVSKVLLPVEIERPPFDSLIAPTAVVEELTERVRHLLGDEQDERIRELYRIYEALDVMPRKPLEEEQQEP